MSGLARAVAVAAAGVLIAGLITAVVQSASGTGGASTAPTLRPGRPCDVGLALAAPAPLPLPPGVTPPPTTAGSHSPIAGPDRPLEVQPAFPGSPEGNPAAARALAASLLARVELPPGSRRISEVPPALSTAFSAPMTPNLVDVTRAWTLQTDTVSATTYLAGNPPRGTSCGGSGYSAGPSTTTIRELTYTVDNLPAAIDSAQLILVVAPRDQKSSALRVDAQVVFAPDRNPAERVPARDTVVTVNRVVTGGRTTTRLITDAAAVRRLAAVLDGLQPASPGLINCPEQSEAYNAAFAPDRGGVADFVATVGACAFITVALRGTTLQPALADRDLAFERALDALLA